MEEIIIREAEPQDAKDLLELMKRVGGETDNLTFGSEGFPFTVEEEADFLKANQTTKNSVFYVAVVNGELAGAGSLSGLSRRMGHRASMGLSVAKKHWNKGIGGQLMDALIAYAKANEIELINLEVKADNENAIHLYEKKGFQTIGLSPAFHKIGDEYLDFMLMYLDLRG